MFQFSWESNTSLLNQLKAQHHCDQFFIFPMLQEELPAPAAHHQAESEAAGSNEALLDLIHSLEINLIYQKRLNSLRLVVLGNRSVIPWMRRFQDPFLVYLQNFLIIKYTITTKEREWRFPSKVNCFWQMKLRICCKTVS